MMEMEQPEKRYLVGQDIDRALRGWDFKPSVVQARLVDASDGRQVLQMRVDLGILQMELSGRPDGSRPHGFPTYFEYLRHQAAQSRRNEQKFRLNDEQCVETDREFVQFYHRRVCWLALRNYERAIADADHNLEFMEFVKSHSPSEEYTLSHEQYRGFVLFHRTQAAAALALERNDAEAAIDELHAGLQKMQAFFTEYNMEERFDEDAMVQELRKTQDEIREKYSITSTLREQLAEAVANEEYETAARLRDALRKRGK
jgi:hypothetical protein